MSNLNMPVKFCTDENGNPYSPVVYQESMFNDDASRMDPVPRKMFAKAYDPTKTYPTENLFCIQDNKYYKFTGSGTTTGTFDPTKWTETDDATELTALNSTLTDLFKTTSLLSWGSYGTVSPGTEYTTDNNYPLNRTIKIAAGANGRYIMFAKPSSYASDEIVELAIGSDKLQIVFTANNKIKITTTNTNIVVKAIFVFDNLML